MYPRAVVECVHSVCQDSFLVAASTSALRASTSTSCATRRLATDPHLRVDSVTQASLTIPERSTATLLRVIATAADALWVVDRDGYIRFLNPAAAAILGYADPAELVGRSSHATIHYKHADGSPSPVECPASCRPRADGSHCASDP
jgi:PAS domain-containing protein